MTSRDIVPRWLMIALQGGYRHTGVKVQAGITPVGRCRMRLSPYPTCPYPTCPSPACIESAWIKSNANEFA
jgi:hypothetical protein